MLADGPAMDRGAIICVEAQLGQCVRRVFDNDTGRMTNAEGACDRLDFDSEGRPIYQGSVKRTGTEENTSRTGLIPVFPERSSLRISHAV